MTLFMVFLFFYVILTASVVGFFMDLALIKKKSKFIFWATYAVVFGCRIYFTKIGLFEDKGLFYSFLITFIILFGAFNVYAIVSVCLESLKDSSRKVCLSLIFLSFFISTGYLYYLDSTASLKFTSSHSEKLVAHEYEEMVWVTANGKRYHSDQNCSNMTNPDEIPLSEAEDLGYTPCKKCY